MVTNRNLSLVQSAALIAQQKQSVTSKRMLLDWLSIWHDLNPAYVDLILGAMLLNRLQR